MSRRFAVAVLATLGFAAAPAAHAGNLDVRLGGFFPRAESNLFDDDAELYTVGRNDWRGFSGGAEFSWEVARNVEIGVHVDGYERKVNTVYRDFINDRTGNDIGQTLRLNIVPMGVSLRYVPLGKRAPISPYIAAGPDIFYYRYEEYGDFVDFLGPRRDIISDSFISEGAAFGFHVAGGVQVPVGRDFALLGEVRYQHAKTDMNDDFRRNRLDVGGATVTVGGRLRF
jgi:opacity protein-like surface antigen